MLDDPLHTSDSCEPLVGEGKYYPTAYEKRHRPRDRRKTNQSTCVSSRLRTVIKRQPSEYAADSLRAVMANDEARRRMGQRVSDEQQAALALEANATKGRDADPRICHLMDRAKQNICWHPAASRDRPISPQLRPQDNNLGSVTPLELDSATMSGISSGEAQVSRHSLPQCRTNDDLLE